MSTISFSTNIVLIRNVRAFGKKNSMAKKKKIKGVLKRGTFEVIPREDVTPDGKVFPGRLVLAIKSS